MMPHPLLNRRNFLMDPAWGLGGIALASLLAQEGTGAPIRPVIDPRDPLAPGRVIIRRRPARFW